MFTMLKRIVKKITRYNDPYYEWRRRNTHNGTRLERKIPLDLVSVGKYTYGPIEVYSWGNSQEGLTIGNFCSIARGVKFLLGGGHNYRTVLSFPVSVKILGAQKEATTKGPIIIDDDVWIGTDSLILSGVHIGKGAVIGAGSVVAKDIPPYAIAYGNPVEIRAYRFSAKVIETLLSLDYSRLTYDMIKRHSEVFINEYQDNELIEKLKMLKDELSGDDV